MPVFDEALPALEDREEETTGTASFLEIGSGLRPGKTLRKEMVESSPTMASTSFVCNTAAAAVASSLFISLLLSLCVCSR